MHKVIYTFLILIVLAACSAPQLPTPAPTPQAIYSSFPSALQPWGDKLSSCAASNPLVALYRQPYSPSNTDLSTNDLTFSLGEPSHSNQSIKLTQVGKEKVVVVVNRDNKLSKLSLDQLRAIISGGTTKWENGSGQPIQVWVYPADDPVRAIFDQVVGISPRLATDAMLAPDLQAMLEAVSGNKDSIGYLTGTFLTEGDPSLTSQVKIMPIDPVLDEKLSIPVIAITQGEPEGLIRELLVCLQAKQ